MQVYVYYDTDVDQWDYSVGRDEPVISELRPTVEEIRTADMDAELYVQMLMGEIPQVNHSHDGLLSEYFEGGTVWWTKGGVVNGSE